MAPKKAAPPVVRYEPTAEGFLQYSEKHEEIFGRGWRHTVYTKALLMHVEEGLRNLWRKPDGSYKFRVERQGGAPGTKEAKFETFFREHFKAITGFEVTRAQEFKAEVKANNGYLTPWADKGPKPVKLEEEFAGLKDWMNKEVEKASRGSYLTIKRLMDKFKEDFIQACAGPLQEGEDTVEPVRNMPGKEVFRRALHNMEADYTKRRLKRLDARESADVLKQLDDFTQWTVDNHITRPSKYQPGKTVYSYRPGVRVGAGDESYSDSTEYRDNSWTMPGMRFKDFLKRNSRLAMVHTIFSEENKDKNGDWLVEPAVWCTQWKKKRDGYKYYGKTNAENLEAIYGDGLQCLGNKAPPADAKILLLDNYSAHKRIRTELRGNPDQIIQWAENSDEVSQEIVNTINALHQTAAQMGKDVERKELLKTLQEGGVAIHALARLAKDYNGAEIKYLPPYYSELNPIELLWAEVKRYYRDETNPQDDWQKRMKEAWESISPRFIESCFDRSIRWALKKHKERQDQAKAEAEAPEPEQALGDANEEEGDDEDEHEYDEVFEELLAEEDLEAMDEDIEE